MKCSISGRKVVWWQARNNREWGFRITPGSSRWEPSITLNVALARSRAPYVTSWARVLLYSWPLTAPNAHRRYAPPVFVKPSSSYLHPLGHLSTRVENSLIYWFLIIFFLGQSMRADTYTCFSIIYRLLRIGDFPKHKNHQFHSSILQLFPLARSNHQPSWWTFLGELHARSTPLAPRRISKS